MKVLYDYQIFRKQRYGGISRYFTNLIKYAEEDDVSVPCFHSKNYYYNQHIGGYDHKYESMIFEYINDVISRRLTIQRLSRGDVDIFHPTYNDPYFLKLIKDQKMVVTVHDLAIERYPQRFNDSDAFIARRRQILDAADHIIAVSNNTKRELMDYYDVPEQRITVVYHGLSKEFGKVNIRLRGLPERYLLYVGQRRGNKNFGRFAVAFSKLIQTEKNLSLLCVGGGEITDEERSTITKLGLEKRVQQRNLNDAVLAACYKQAEAFVYPSLYEGFGIPILEAFAMHCPIILSDIGSFREVAGDYGTYFNPQNIDSIYETLKWMMNPKNKALIEERVQKGAEELTHFTLENTYLNTRKVYSKLLDKEAE